MNEEGEKQDNSKGRVGNIFNKFYEFSSHLKVKFYFRLIYGILAIHLSVYAVALARYEFAVFSLDAKIANLITLSEGKDKSLALRTIPRLQLEIPVEPRVYDIFSSIKSLFPCFDDNTPEAYKELSYLLAHNKFYLKGLDLSDFKFVTGKDFKSSPDFRFANFNDVGLIRANLAYNFFQDSNFFAVDFSEAQMNNADFAFSTFEGCALHMANLEFSNLCGVNFVNIELGVLNLSHTNLVGADLSGFLLHPSESLPNLNGAYYNSDSLKWY